MRNFKSSFANLLRVIYLYFHLYAVYNTSFIIPYHVWFYIIIVLLLFISRLCPNNNNISLQRCTTCLLLLLFSREANRCCRPARNRVRPFRDRLLPPTTDTCRRTASGKWKCVVFERSGDLVPKYVEPAIAAKRYENARRGRDFCKLRVLSKLK